MKNEGVEIRAYLVGGCVCPCGAGERHGPLEVPRAKASGGIKSVVGRGLGWRRCAAGEEAWRGPSWGCHKPERAAAAEGQSLVEACDDVGVLVEGERGMGPFLEKHQTGAPVDGMGLRGYTGVEKA